MQSIFHNGNKFTVAEKTITIGVENGKDSVDQMRRQISSSADFDSSVKLIWKFKKILCGKRTLVGFITNLHCHCTVKQKANCSRNARCRQQRRFSKYNLFFLFYFVRWLWNFGKYFFPPQNIIVEFFLFFRVII